MWEFKSEISERLDRLLRQSSLPDKEWMSRQAWEQCLSEGRVRVDGRVQRKAGQEITKGAVVQIDLPPLGIIPDEKPAVCLWSNSEFGFFLKDPGLDTYPLMPWERETFANQVAQHLAQQNIMNAQDFQRLAAPPILEGGIVQRLDRDTSGIISVAFTSSAKQLFRKVISEHKMEKKYLAIVAGQGVPDQEVTLHYLLGSKIVKAFHHEKPSSEQALLRLKKLSSADNFHLYEIATSFGMRHVIRAGMAALQLPLVGDSTYGGNTEAGEGHLLHAYSLESHDPSLVFPVVKAPLSLPFLATLRRLGLHYTG